jgi:hypothetical protein
VAERLKISASTCEKLPSSSFKKIKSQLLLGKVHGLMSRHKNVLGILKAKPFLLLYFK